MRQRVRKAGPSASLQWRFAGGVPERPKGAGCKPVGSAYGGSISGESRPAMRASTFTGITFVRVFAPSARVSRLCSQLMGRTGRRREWCPDCWNWGRRLLGRARAGRSRRPVARVGISASLQWRIAGGVPERPKGAGCKPVGSAYGGSNPPSPTRFPGRGSSRPAEPASGAACRRWRHDPLRVRVITLPSPGSHRQRRPGKARAEDWSGRGSYRPGATGLRGRLTPLAARRSTGPCYQHCPLRRSTTSGAPRKREALRFVRTPISSRAPTPGRAHPAIP